jgi:hypothetical protein
MPLPLDREVGLGPKKASSTGIPVTLTATLYFGNHLTAEDFRDDTVRTETLERGRDQLSEFSDVHILNVMPAACAMTIQGSERSISELRTKLADVGIARIAVDDRARPAFRAAR